MRYLKIVAIIQARMGSTRLPGKILKNVGGKTVLEHVISRVRAARGIDEIVVATTTKRRDDTVVNLVQDIGVKIFRGSEDDVLDRYYKAASFYKADVVLRITSDCPLLDPQVLTEMAAYYRASNADYFSNTIVRTMPRGLDAEFFTFQALKLAWHNSNKKYEREHVTPYIYEHPDIFKLRGLIWSPNLSHLRLTIDTDEDYKLISEIYRLMPGKNIFGIEEILSLLEKFPYLKEINSHIRQKALHE